MRIYRLLYFIIFLVANKTIAQESLKNTIEFEKDKFSLSTQARLELDRLCDTLKKINLLEVQMIGHTDSDANDAYNLILSKNRVTAVQNYLIHKGIDATFLVSEFEGETHPVASNEDEDGMKKNRRVEIIVNYRLPIELVEPFLKPNDCKADTMVRLEKGTLVKINKCLYENNPDCIQIKEILNQADAGAAGLETVDTRGNLLVSGGMFEYDICEGVEVVFYAESSRNCFSGSMDLWEIDGDGKWKKISDQPLETVEMDGVNYYPINVSGFGMCNLDQLPPRVQLNKIKFKSEGGLQLDTVILSCDCAFWRVSAGPTNKRKRKVKIEVLCCIDTQVDIAVTTPTNDTLIFEVQPLANLERGSRRGYCSNKIEKKWWIFNKRERGQYRKYKVRLKHFNHTEKKETG